MDYLIPEFQEYEHRLWTEPDAPKRAVRVGIADYTDAIVARLTPAEARKLAAMIVAVADQIDPC